MSDDDSKDRVFAEAKDCYIDFAYMEFLGIDFSVTAGFADGATELFDIIEEEDKIVPVNFNQPKEDRDLRLTDATRSRAYLLPPVRRSNGWSHLRRSLLRRRVNERLAPGYGCRFSAKTKLVSFLSRRNGGFIVITVLSGQ